MTLVLNNAKQFQKKVIDIFLSKQSIQGIKSLTVRETFKREKSWCFLTLRMTDKLNGQSRIKVQKVSSGLNPDSDRK